MRSIIITGAGRKLGKTMVSCGVIRRLCRCGYTVSAFKLRPVEIDDTKIHEGPGRKKSDTWRFHEAGATKVALIDFSDPSRLMLKIQLLSHGSDFAVMEGGTAVPFLSPEILIYIDGDVKDKRHGDLTCRAHVNVHGPPDEQKIDRISSLVIGLLRLPNTDSFRVDMKYWISLGESPIMGEGISGLLAAVRDTGSILSASEATGIPYKRAWILINETESKLGASLLHCRRGGSEGGGSKLTSLGERLLSAWEKTESALRSAGTLLEM